MVVFMVGICTSKYDAILNPDGFTFGTFFGKRIYLWTEIKAVYVLREVTGKQVCLELNSSRTQSAGIALKRLPGTYGMDADEFAKTLLRWQREHANARS